MLKAFAKCVDLVIRFATILIGVALELVLLGFPLFLAWNILVPHLTGLPSISFLQAMAMAFFVYFVFANLLNRVKV